METRDLRAKYRAVDLWSLVAVGRLSVCAHATPLALHSRYYGTIVPFFCGRRGQDGGRTGGREALCRSIPPVNPAVQVIPSPGPVGVRDQNSVADRGLTAEGLSKRVKQAGYNTKVLCL